MSDEIDRLMRDSGLLVSLAQVDLIEVLPRLKRGSTTSLEARTAALQIDHYGTSVSRGLAARGSHVPT